VKVEIAADHCDNHTGVSGDLGTLISIISGSYVADQTLDGSLAFCERFVRSLDWQQLQEPTWSSRKIPKIRNLRKVYGTASSLKSPW
jgi:hypothetical protein